MKTLSTPVRVQRGGGRFRRRQPVLLSAEAEELAYINHPSSGAYHIVFHDDLPGREDECAVRSGEVAFIFSRELCVRLPVVTPARKTVLRIRLRLLRSSGRTLHPLLAMIGPAYACALPVFQARFSKVIGDLIEPAIQRRFADASSDLVFEAGSPSSETILEALRTSAASEGLAVRDLRLEA